MTYMVNFRTYQLSTQLYQAAKTMKLSHPLQDQLIRAASSISLNLMEGSAKPTAKDRAKFYRISLGSLREVQALIDLEREELEALSQLADQVGGHLYRLCKNTK